MSHEKFLGTRLPLPLLVFLRRPCNIVNHSWESHGVTLDNFISQCVYRDLKKKKNVVGLTEFQRGLLCS